MELKDGITISNEIINSNKQQKEALYLASLG